MQNNHPGTLKSYTVGFTLSLLLTIIPYFIVVNKLASGSALIACLIGFGFLQLLVQLFFFLHLGQEVKPRWNLLIFLFMILILLILVLGSLWIMYNLDYNMMSPHETNQYIEDEEGIRR